MNGVVLVHAVAALLFGAVALWQWNGTSAALPQRRLIGALALTALWALAVGGIGSGDVAARVLLSARDLAWLYVLSGIAARGPAERLGRWRTAAFAVTAACAIMPALLAVAAIFTKDAVAYHAIGATALVLRMLYAAAATVLAYRVLVADGQGHGGRRVLVAALALLWATDLINTALAYFLGDWTAPMLIGRGLVAALIAPVIALAVQRGGAWQLSVSQTMAVRAIGALALTLYALATVAAAGLLGTVGEGNSARMIQTAVVVGAATSLLTLASTPWLRAWARVVVAKHLFAHRYDYRAAWTRFGETLGRTDDGARPLGQRVLEALAELTDSPAALLLSREGDALRIAGTWRWPTDGEDAGAATVTYLEQTHRIVDLGAVRAGDAPTDEIAAIPAWALTGEAWAIVPLLHVDRLVGAAVLAPPPLSRPLDWEDFDLLGVAGRQVASLLAEERAAAALAEARRFEEFNRRFAFIMHDLKNLVSQTALVARNAERHGDDPAFRADMVATLRDTSQRMTALLARLGGHATQGTETPAPVALLSLARRIAAGSRALHPVEVSGNASEALAHAAALETALSHLVRNAIDASAPGQPVTLSIAEDRGAATIAIADTGCGMSPAFVHGELFRPFASAKPGGFGLGAFEARQLIEQMGGTLSVESREGEGTRFTVRLPLTPALEAAA